MITNIENDYQKIDEVDVGENVKICSFVNLYGCKIGNGSKVGSFVEIQKGSSIGCNCKIQSHTFICEGVHIGNGVFVGHNVSFINDKYPKAVNKDGDLIDSYDEWQLRQTFVEDEVSIGTSATIMGGVTIGKGATIGAGAMVLKDVPPGCTVVGNPAHIVR